MLCVDECLSVCVVVRCLVFVGFWLVVMYGCLLVVVVRRLLFVACRLLVVGSW